MHEYEPPIIILCMPLSFYILNILLIILSAHKYNIVFVKVKDWKILYKREEKFFL